MADYRLQPAKTGAAATLNVDGEIMETLWSSLNIISPSTRGMVTPHRQEMLDFQMNDSNFVKMIRMRESAGIISIQS